MRERLKRLRTFELVVPKTAGHIDWVKCTALLPHFRKLTALFVTAGNDFQPAIRALEPSILPTTLTELKLRFCGVVDTFASSPAMFSHLKTLESLNIEQRASLTTEEACIGLLELPKSLTRLRVWATNYELPRAPFSMISDLENPNVRLTIESTHVESLFTLGKVLDFRTNLLTKKTSPPPFFEGQIMPATGLKMTHLFLSLEYKVVDFALLPPTLLQICVFVRKDLRHSLNVAHNLDRVNYQSFPQLQVLIIGKDAIRSVMPWSWVADLPQSLRKLDCPLIPLSDPQLLQEVLSTLESRNDDYFNHVGDNERPRRFVPALITSFEISCHVPSRLSIPVELIHCFPSLEEALISRTCHDVSPSVHYKVGKCSESEKNDFVWPPGVKRITSNRLELIEPFHSMYSPFCEFLARETSMAIEERDLKSSISKNSSNSSQPNDYETSPSSSSSNRALNLLTSPSSHLSFSGRQEKAITFSNRFNFCASTMTSLSVNFGFGADHLVLLPFTIRELRIDSCRGDIWSELCVLATTRFPDLEIVSLLSTMPHYAIIEHCPSSVRELELSIVNMNSFDGRHLANLRILTIKNTALEWESLAFLPPFLESLDIKLAKKFDFSNLSSQSPFPRTLQHLRFCITELNSIISYNPTADATCAFRTEALSLSSFLEEESRFYRYILQGLDRLTSISVPLVPSTKLLRHYERRKFFAGLSHGRWLNAIRYYLVLRIPFYSLFAGAKVETTLTSHVLWRRRVQTLFGSCNSLSSIATSSGVGLDDNSPFLLQCYMDSRRLRHNLNCEETMKDSPFAAYAFGTIPIVVLCLGALGARSIISYTSGWLPTHTLSQVVSNLTQTSLSGSWWSRICSISLPSFASNSVLAKPMNWRRTWFVLNAISAVFTAIQLEQTQAFGAGSRSLLQMLQNAAHVVMQIKQHYFPELSWLHEYAWLGIVTVYLFFPFVFPIFYPSKTNFFIIEFSLLAICTWFARDRN